MPSRRADTGPPSRNATGGFPQLPLPLPFPAVTGCPLLTCCCRMLRASGLRSWQPQSGHPPPCRPQAQCPAEGCRGREAEPGKPVGAGHSSGSRGVSQNMLPGCAAQASAAAAAAAVLSRRATRSSTHLRVGGLAAALAAQRRQHLLNPLACTGSSRRQQGSQSGMACIKTRHS